MRNKITLTALLLVSLALTGCREGNIREREEVSETVSSAQYESNSSVVQLARDPLPRAECEQIMALLKAWGDLDYNIHPDQTNTNRDDYFPECVNTERFLDEELTVRDGIRTYTERFFLIESGDFATEAGFTSRLDEMFTEGFKARYLSSTGGQMFRFKDDEVYVAGFGNKTLSTPATVRLEIEENGDTITITAYTPESDDNWSAVLARTDNGFKIADVGDGAMFSLPLLFSGSDVRAEVFFGGAFAFTL